MPKPHIELIARGVWIHASHVLVCRNRKHGHSFLPGGHIEFGEPAQVALAREIQEELGLALRVTDSLGAIEASFTQGVARQRHHEINLFFRLHQAGRRSTSLPPVVSQETHIEFLWIPLIDLANRRSGIRMLPKSTIPLVLQAAKAKGGRGGQSARQDLTFMTDWD